MRHSLTIDGPAFRLRPVCIEDAAFIAALRADPERGRYLHRGSGQAQCANANGSKPISRATATTIF